MSLPMISTAMNEPAEQVQHGVDVVIYDPKTGDDTDIVIRVSIGDAAHNYIADRKRQFVEGRLMVSENRRGFRPSRAPKVARNEEDPKIIQNKMLAFCTLSWQNIKLKGEALPFTEENAMMFYTNYPWIARQVFDVVNDLGGIEALVASPAFGQSHYRIAQATHRHWGAWNRHFSELGPTDPEMMELFRVNLSATPWHDLSLCGGGFLPLWTGEAVSRLAIILTFGFGDQLLVGRYLRALSDRVERVSVIVSGSLRELFEKNKPSKVDVFDYGHCADGLEDAKAHLYSLLLPHEIGGYGDAAWLAVDRPERDPDAPARIGICWTGNTENPNNNLRAIPPERFAPLLEIPGVEWHSLQADRRAVPPDGVIDHAHELKNFMDTAKLIATLDLVVSIDSAVANLAASMGFPLWVMIERAGESDFRWGTGGESTPWFPSARVFRQGNDRKWKTVIKCVAAALVEWKAARDYEARARIVSAASQALNLGRSRCGMGH